MFIFWGGVVSLIIILYLGNNLLRFNQFSTSSLKITTFEMAQWYNSGKEFNNYIKLNDYPDSLVQISPVAEFTILNKNGVPFSPKSGIDVRDNYLKTSGAINLNYDGYRDHLNLANQASIRFFIENPRIYWSVIKHQFLQILGYPGCWVSEERRSKLHTLEKLYFKLYYNFGTDKPKCIYAGVDKNFLIIILLSVFLFILNFFLIFSNKLKVFGDKKIYYVQENKASVVITIYSFINLCVLVCLGYGEHYRYRFEIEVPIILSLLVSLRSLIIGKTIPHHETKRV
jgi:hypothetical protein